MIVDEQLLELQRFAELGRASATLLHEISNPLTAALLNLELNYKSHGVKQARRNMMILHRYVEAARQQVKQRSCVQSFWVEPQITQLKTVFIPLARRASVKLKIGVIPSCQLYGDPIKFQQIISNLISNALDACGRGGKVEISCSITKDTLVIRVQDSAHGIRQDLMPRLFENSSSSKLASGQGLGLGLSIVKHYVEKDFGGTIAVSSRLGKGSCFRLEIPVMVVVSEI